MSEMPDDPGKLLFEDDWYFRTFRRFLMFIGFELIFLGIILGIWIRFFSETKGPIGAILLICGLFIGMALFSFYMRSTLDNFQLYEKGMLFTTKGNIPFLPFEDIDHIIKVNDQRIAIYRKFPQRLSPLYIAAGRSKSMAMFFIGDWSRFMEILETKLKEAHPERDVADLIHRIPENQMDIESD
jgi:hypothetical protein